MFLSSMTNVASASNIDEVRATVYAWVDTWQSRNFIRYMSYYSPTFQSKELDYQRWLEKKAQHFSETQDINVKIFDLWVLIEGKIATAKFVQRYRDAKFMDLGEKTLILANVRNKWLIISEEWSSLEMSDQTTWNKKTFQKSKLFDTKPNTVDKSLGNTLKTLSPKKIVVKNIQYKSEKGRDKVFVSLNTFATPQVLTLAGDTPRVVVDIKHVSFWKGPYKTPVKGKLIKQIRTYFHHDTEKLRIVLDLKPSQNYIIDQTFDRNENRYSIEVR